MKFREQSGRWGQAWHLLSDCGMYAIRIEGSEFVALHIAALWSTAEEIGRYPTQAKAEARCAKYKPTQKSAALLAKAVA